MDFGKIFDTIKGPLLTAASTLIPGGPLILGAVNAMLPEDKKLTENATGQDIRNAVNQLNPEQRASLMEKELDVEIAEIKGWSAVQASLSQADQAGASTRPKIALMMAWCVVFAIVVFMVAWVAVIATDDVFLIDSLSDSWALFGTVIGTPTLLLRAYFGMRTREKTTRYNAAAGQPTNQATGIAAGLVNAFKN